MYSIKTEVCGNPDFGQDPSQPPYGVVVETLHAETMTELRKIINEWMGDNNIGGGNWMNPKVLKNGKTLGFMSYNGRVWDRSPWSNNAQRVEEV